MIVATPEGLEIEPTLVNSGNNAGRSSYEVSIAKSVFGEVFAFRA